MKTPNSLRASLSSLVAVVVVLLLSGCGSEEGGGPSVLAALALPLVETCSGKYVCDAEGDDGPFEIGLEKRGASCAFLTAYILEADHSARLELQVQSETIVFSGTWSGSTAGFTVRVDRLTIRCAPFGGEPPAVQPPSGPKCGGVAYCGPYGVQNCTLHPGCGIRNEWLWVGDTPEPFPICKGEPAPCTTHQTEDVCKAEGCDWE